MAVIVCLAGGGLLGGAGSRALLATAILAAVVWLGLEAWTVRRSLASAGLIITVALALLVALPAALLAADPSLSPDAAPVSRGLELLALGVFSLLGGCVAALQWRRQGVPPRASRTPGPPGPLSRRRRVVFVLIPAVGALVFLAAVGGPSRYFANLDDTGELTKGLTYLIWLMLAGKYLALAVTARRWQAGLAATRWQVISLVAALLLVAAIGARLLLVVAILQVALTWLLLHRPQRLPWRRLLALVLLLGVVFVGLGELRRWQDLDSPRSFPAYLADEGLPNLSSTYVNQYADAVRLASLVRGVVPGRADYEYGREIAPVILQPIPGAIRPRLEAQPALRETFTSGTNGNALPLPVVGYIQFGLLGVIAFCAALGVLVGSIDRLLARKRDLTYLLPLVAGCVGVAVIFRGSLSNAIAFTLMDVIGLYLAARFSRAPQDA